MLVNKTIPTKSRDLSEQYRWNTKPTKNTISYGRGKNTSWKKMILTLAHPRTPQTTQFQHIFKNIIYSHKKSTSYSLFKLYKKREQII
jgi:hypothetical protein